MEQYVIQARQIIKYFHDPVKQQVLKGIDLSITHGQFVAITGKSGCGKSTLLYILSTMDTDYEGELFIGGASMKNRSDSYLAKVRNEHIGFVFQFHYLLNEFTVLRNVMLPAQKSGKYNIHEIQERAMQKLKILGIEREYNKMPNQLSGGQKQRVAIARALINDPLLLIADEPTGNLDKRNSNIVFEIFQKLAVELGQSLLVVTHDTEFAQRTQRVVEMSDGSIISDVMI
jgi:lipoprotein-releasing system ATP-binding protein